MRSRAAVSNAKARRNYSPPALEIVFLSGVAIVVVDKRATFLDKPRESIASACRYGYPTYPLLLSASASDSLTLSPSLSLKFLRSSPRLADETRVRPSVFTAGRMNPPPWRREKPDNGVRRAYQRKMSPQQSGGRFPRDGRNRTCQRFAHGGESVEKLKISDGERRKTNGRRKRESSQPACSPPAGKNEGIRLLLYRQVAASSWIFSLAG